MPSEQGVTYIDFGLNSVAAFWDRLIVPDVRTFVQEPSARSAFDASYPYGTSMIGSGAKGRIELVDKNSLSPFI